MDERMPRIDGLYETHLTVADLGRSIAFYCDVVGLELAKVFEERRIAFFFLNGRKTAMLGLWEAGSGPLAMRLHLAFAMSLDGVLASAAALKAKGVEPLGFSGQLASEPEVIGWMPAVSQYFADPDGHSLEFIAVLDEEADAAFGVRPYSEWRRRQPLRVAAPAPRAPPRPHGRGSARPAAQISSSNGQ